MQSTASYVPASLPLVPSASVNSALNRRGLCRTFLFEVEFIAEHKRADKAIPVLKICRRKEKAPDLATNEAEN